MGTPAFYYVPQEDGTYLRGRVGWDGYPEHVGKYLVKFYTDLAKARALVEKGWIITIESDPSMVSGETFDGEEPARLADLDAARKDARLTGYSYLLLDGVWHTCPTRGPLKPLTREHFESKGNKLDRKAMQEWFANPLPPGKSTAWIEQARA